MDVAALLSPPTQSDQQGPWLSQVALLLRGYRNFPLVLRHHVVREEGRYRADVEVRRWSDESYLRLNEDTLWLDAQGRLWQSQLQHRRWIRQVEGEQIFDDIFSVQRLTRPTLDQLDLALTRLIGQGGPLFWQNWEKLQPHHQARLVAVGQSWEVLQPALEHSSARAQAALPLLLSEQAHPASRLALLEAGSQGLYAPPAETLPWLLLQVEWNLSPGVLGLARASVARHPHQAWALRSHPNPVVRRRLAQILPARQPWLDWLAAESDTGVRQTLRLRVEEEMKAAQLVEQLTVETDPLRRGALGWLLVHWSQPLDSKRVKRILSPPHLELLKKRRQRV